MDVLRLEELTPEKIKKEGHAKIHILLLKVDDLKARAQTMIANAADTTWLSQVDPIDKKAWEARAEKTINLIVDEIIGKTDLTDIGADFGEYMVSYAALDGLAAHFDHAPIPLAEIFKEKLSGNPGFDFHTETPTVLIAFGEAKYSKESDAQGRAMKQIAKFINEKKDHSETIYLKSFVSKEAVHNLVNSEKRAFAAAFSVNSDVPNDSIESALKSSLLDPLLHHEELYLIGVTLK